MSIKQILRKFLFGVDFAEEYICLKDPHLAEPLEVFLTDRSKDFFQPVSNCLIFLGYKPLIMAVTLPIASEASTRLRAISQVCLSYCSGNFVIDSAWKGFSTSSNALATVLLEKAAEKALGENQVFIWTGVQASHHFLSNWHQATQRLRNSFNRRKRNWLAGNLYDQVRIAYSVPTNISIISVSKDNRVNMFPTDLHGEVGSTHYISSLRHNSKSTAQVEEIKILALSKIESAQLKQAYAMGRNHMADLTDETKFSPTSTRSMLHGLPLPNGVLSYRELMRMSSIDIGIHRIHFYESQSTGSVREGPSLSHIHCFYAQWRKDHHVRTEYLFR